LKQELCPIARIKVYSSFAIHFMSHQLHTKLDLSSIRQNKQYSKNLTQCALLLKANLGYPFAIQMECFIIDSSFEGDE